MSQLRQRVVMPNKKKKNPKTVVSLKKHKKTVKQVSKITKKHVIKSKGDNWNKGSISKTKTTVRVNNRPTIIVRGGGGSASTVAAAPPHPIPHPYGRQFVEDYPVYMQNRGHHAVQNGAPPPANPDVDLLGGGGNPNVPPDNNRIRDDLLGNPIAVNNPAAVIEQVDQGIDAMEPQGIPEAVENQPSNIFNGRPRRVNNQGMIENTYPTDGYFVPRRSSPYTGERPRHRDQRHIMVLGGNELDVGSAYKTVKSSRKTPVSNNQSTDANWLRFRAIERGDLPREALFTPITY